MEKQFDPSSYEQKWQRHWSARGFFRAAETSSRPSYCIAIPPPNVTGKLHMGHALQTAIQDLLTRWRRMLGFNALWLPGTDHAGIATQLMVERQVAEEGLDRVTMGRAAFLEKLWQWKERHQGNIREQMDQLGASCDWSRERFTMDEGLSVAVREAFVRLYREELIYRGEYMVNWSPGLDTAISDLEVEMKTVAGHLWRIAYPVAGSDERIVVATTRPETMLGDTAVAFHPDDDRYRHLVGKTATLPLVGRRIPFIQDELVDPEFGTGLVKVTPSHDPADFEMGRRHDLDFVQVIDRLGRMTPAAGEPWSGLDRFEARRRVVAALEEQGYLVGVDDYEHNVGHCQRSGVPIEPLVSTQWFCEVSGMARQALEAVRDGRIELVPDSWEKTWAHWLENIKPWCISRQLWWGHQIPAWYDPEGNCWVAHDVDEAARAAGVTPDQLRRDEDVLDTWFSSALWPFSTLGWPEETPDLGTFYPTSVMVTGFDILFFWVARMVMTGMHFTGEVPFHTVHLTGLVRDADGQKMSKTKGNTVDPLDLVGDYGADAVRFTLAILNSPGRDIPLDPERMAGYRAFGNKIWNAVRFALSRIPEGTRLPESFEIGELAAPERWMLSRLSRVAGEVDERFEQFRFDEACHRLYHFFWGDLCDWYIEMSKPALSGEAPRPQVAEVLLTALDRSLRLLHPVMPFLTEELWQRLPDHNSVHPETICLAPYPKPVAGWEDAAAEAGIDRFAEIVSRVRTLRAELRISPRDPIGLWLWSDGDDAVSGLAELEPLARFLLRLEDLHLEPAPSSAHRDRVAGLELGLTASDRDLGREQREDVEQEAADVELEIGRVDAQLANDQFVAKAPAAVVEQRRQRRAELVERLETLRSALKAAE